MYWDDSENPSLLFTVTATINQLSVSAVFCYLKLKCFLYFQPKERTALNLYPST